MNFLQKLWNRMLCSHELRAQYPALFAHLQSHAKPGAKDPWSESQSSVAENLANDFMGEAKVDMMKLHGKGLFAVIDHIAQHLSEIEAA